MLKQHGWEMANAFGVLWHVLHGVLFERLRDAPRTLRVCGVAPPFAGDSWHGLTPSLSWVCGVGMDFVDCS